MATINRDGVRAKKVTSGDHAGFYHSYATCAASGQGKCIDYDDDMRLVRVKTSEIANPESVFVDYSDPTYSFIPFFPGKTVTQLRDLLYVMMTNKQGPAPPDWCPSYMDPCLPSGICTKCPSSVSAQPVSIPVPVNMSSTPTPMVPVACAKCPECPAIPKCPSCPDCPVAKCGACPDCPTAKCPECPKLTPESNTTKPYWMYVAIIMLAVAGFLFYRLNNGNNFNF